MARPRLNLPARRYATYRRFDGTGTSGIDTQRMIRIGGGIAVVGGIIYVSNLEKAPISGRSRFMIIGKRVEQWVGRRGYTETMAQYGRSVLPASHPDVRRVRSIMKRIIAVSGITDVDWEINVIDDPNAPPNAFVLPGGKVFVFRSILPICANDDGLATVLAHETAHQVNRHTAENLSAAPFYMLLSLVMYTITGSDRLNSLLLNGLLQLPASRTMEREADQVGLIIMSRACFDPGEAVHLWERMSQYEQRAAGRFGGGGSVPEFFSTHPSSPNRIQLIKGWLPSAYAERENSGCNSNMGSLMDSFRGAW